MTDKERAEVYKISMEGDAIAIDTGQVNPADMASYRFGGQTYAAAPPTFEQDDLDAQENAAALAEAERAKMQAE